MAEPTIPASIVAKSLSAVVGKVWPFACKIMQERKAGQNPFETETDFFERSFDSSLGRLRTIDREGRWWKGIFKRLELTFVKPPDFFKISGIQVWLAEQQTASDLKTLAKLRLLDSGEDTTEILSRLEKGYACATGEAATFAKVPIETTVAMLVAGTLVDLSPGERILAGMVQEVSAHQREEFEALREGISALNGRRPIPSVEDEVHGQQARNQLRLILKRRTFPNVPFKEEIAKLVRRVEDGDLQAAPKRTKAEVFYWAARLHALDEESLALTRDYLSKLTELDSDFDTSIIEAWLEAKTGNIENALQKIRKIDTPDGRSNLFSLLLNHKNKKAALDWFDCQEETGVDFLTGVGWKNVCVLLADQGRWELALKLTERLDESYVSDCPDLPYIEGVILSGLLLPDDIRHHALKMQVFERDIDVKEGADIDIIRRKAVKNFEKASEVAMELGAPGRAKGAKIWISWLRLTDPLTRNAEKKKLSNLMLDGRKAVDFVSLAYAFNIEFDSEPLRQYLKSRASAGGLEPLELEAKLTLARHSLPPRDFIGFLEKERSGLMNILELGSFNYLLIKALLDDKQASRAAQILDQNRGLFGDRDYERFSDAIRNALGQDIRRSLEERYEETEDYVDLKNLVNCLRRVRDWNALHPQLLDLFETERNSRNCLGIAACLRHLERDKDLIRFLDDNDDLVQKNEDLMQEKAWALYRFGSLAKAKSFNDELLKRRQSAADRFLDLDLAVQAGDWERFPSILEREWPHIEDHEPTFLLQLAVLGADSETELAVQLIEIAVDKAGNDPVILSTGYILAVALGKDSLAAPWLRKAVDFSDENGPVKPIHVREIQRMAPAWAERSRKINEAYSRGEIPGHLAATMLNLPLSHILLTVPRLNDRQVDPRRRAVIPIRFGGRQPFKLNTKRRLGIDISSLMILEDLGLLEALIEVCEHVVIPPSTMAFLLNELRSVRFHQPSLVQEAKAIRRYLGRGHLQILKPTAALKKTMDPEIPPGLADLLMEASAERGRVIRPLPIYAAGSFLERQASLGELGASVLTTIQICEILREEGILDENLFQTAQGKLAVWDRGTPLGPTELGEGPLYIDDLALMYLHRSGVLEKVFHLEKPVFVHESAVDHLHALMETEAEASEVEEVLDSLRRKLRDGISRGCVMFFSRCASDEDDKESRSLAIEAPTLTEIIQKAGECDVVCIDDRFVGRNPFVADSSGRRVPSVGLTDILDLLVAETKLTTKERHSTLHTLRNKGFALLPIEPMELEYLLSKATTGPTTSKFRETKELRTLRENVDALCAYGILRQPPEGDYLGQLFQTCWRVIKSTWKNESISVDTAIARSDWIYNNLMPNPVKWAHTIDDSTGLASPEEGMAIQLLLMLLSGFSFQEKQDAYFEWFQTKVIEKLLPASFRTLDSLAQMTSKAILEHAKAFANDQLQ